MLRRYSSGEYPLLVFRWIDTVGNKHDFCVQRELALRCTRLRSAMQLTLTNIHDTVPIRNDRDDKFLHKRKFGSFSGHAVQVIDCYSEILMKEFPVMTDDPRAIDWMFRHIAHFIDDANSFNALRSGSCPVTAQEDDDETSNICTTMLSTTSATLLVSMVHIILWMGAPACIISHVLHTLIYETRYCGASNTLLHAVKSFVISRNHKRVLNMMISASRVMYWNSPAVSSQVILLLDVTLDTYFPDENFLQCSIAKHDDTGNHIAPTNNSDIGYFYNNFVCDFLSNNQQLHPFVDDERYYDCEGSCGCVHVTEAYLEPLYTDDDKGLNTKFHFGAMRDTKYVDLVLTPLETKETISLRSLSHRICIQWGFRRASLENDVFLHVEFSLVVRGGHTAIRPRFDFSVGVVNVVGGCDDGNNGFVEGVYPGCIQSNVIAVEGGVLVPRSIAKICQASVMSSTTRTYGNFTRFTKDFVCNFTALRQGNDQTEPFTGGTGIVRPARQLLFTGVVAFEHPL